MAYHERALGDDHRTILVAIEDEEFAGFIYAKREETMAIFDREYDLHIIEIYVREESRQRGVASTLLSEVEAWEPAQDCEYATLVVHVDNQAAHSLYEKHEFEETRTFYAKPLR
ncbi:N-acetyltransferase [Halobacteriales archaeon SW_6_65_15]|nr:MAG: N-acetyltransferase [Halobacteriales archaeon SW_6_65_15]